jgi:hypothetical protein
LQNILKRPEKLKIFKKERAMRKIIFLTTLFALIFTSSVWSADISGTWTIKLKSPMGADDSFDMLFKASGDNFTISADHKDLGKVTGSGTLKGNEIKFVMQSQMGLKINFTGTVTGNEMSGTREVDLVSMQAGAGGGQRSGQGGQGGQAPAGGQGGQGGQASGGGQGGQGGQPPAGGQGGGQGGSQGGQGGGMGAMNSKDQNTWSAAKK